MDEDNLLTFHYPTIGLGGGGLTYKDFKIIVKGEAIDFYTFITEKGFGSLGGTNIPLSDDTNFSVARVQIRATSDENAIRLLSVIETIEDL